MESHLIAIDIGQDCQEEENSVKIKRKVIIQGSFRPISICIMFDHNFTLYSLP